MRLSVLLALVSLTALVGFAPAPFPKRERHRVDESVIQAGRWNFTLWESSGHKSAFSQYLDISPGKVTFVSLRGGPSVTYEFILKPELSPFGFQWKPEGGGGWVGSYRVRGDELTLIFNSGQDFATRPTNFDDPKIQYRFILKRAR